MNQDLIELEKRHVWHPFTPMQAWCDDVHEPLMIVEGRGCVLRDQHGREYLDGNSSIWTNIHGHRHPVIDAAIAEQLQRIAHSSFLGFTNEPAIRLAKALVDLFPGEKLTKVFFSDDGSTAIEAAVRMALQFWRNTGVPQRDTIVSFERGYHGDTLGAASLGGLPVFKGAANDFGYKVLCVESVEALRALDSSTFAAVIIEPLIQGAAGMRTWPKGMLADLDQWRQERDVFLILDEVMTGFGRTGKMFACEHEDVVPDFIALAKGITGGYLPLAATLTSERVFAAFAKPENTFYYGHSYTGNQLGCAAALASLRVFDEERVIERLPGLVEEFASALNELRASPHVREIRQCGLIAGIEVAHPEVVGPTICLAAREFGLLTRPVRNTLVLMPPLCATPTELRTMCGALLKGIERVLNQ